MSPGISFQKLLKVSGRIGGEFCKPHQGDNHEGFFKGLVGDYRHTEVIVSDPWPCVRFKR